MSRDDDEEEGVGGGAGSSGGSSGGTNKLVGSRYPYSVSLKFSIDLQTSLYYIKKYSNVEQDRIDKLKEVYSFYLFYLYYFLSLYFIYLFLSRLLN